jgi:polyketide biosynthesis enoyl-CoA hydratase PksI
MTAAKSSAPENSRIRLERDDRGVRVLTMSDTEGKNTLSASFVELLVERLEEVSEDPEAKVCVLAGLPDIFCAGGDKDMLLNLAKGEVAATDIMVSRSVLEVPIPVIAAMAGHAVGGGLTLGMCCDVLVMAKESSYGCSFMNMGFTPGMGTTRLLQMAVGPFIAAEMMYGGQYFRGSHFEGRTQVNHVVARDKVLGLAMKIARRVADKPRHALELLKRDLSLDKRRAFEAARTTESFMHELCFSREETLALIQERYEEPAD